MLLIEDGIYIITHVYKFVENYSSFLLIMESRLVLMILIHSHSPGIVILNPQAPEKVMH